MARTYRRKNITTRRSIRNGWAKDWDTLYENQLGGTIPRMCSYQDHRDHRVYGLPEEDVQKAKKLANWHLHREEHSGIFGLPREFRNYTRTVPIRLKNKIEIQRCLKQDSFDDHLPSKTGRFMYWW